MATLSFDVFWRDHGAKAGLKGLSTEAKEAAKRQDEFRAKAVLAGAAVGAAIWKFGKDSVQAYVEAQGAQTRLQEAFRKFPKLADVSIGALQDYNAELAKKTRFDDDATSSGQAVLAQFGLTGRQIMAVTPLLQDYAAKTGKDLPAAAEDLGKAMLGQGRALKAVGINFVDTGTAGGNFNQIMGSLRQQVGGFAEAEGKTAAGQAEILKNQFGELQETAGQKLLPALISVGGELLKLVGFVSDNQRVIVPLAAGVAGVAAAVYAVNKAVGAFRATQQAWEAVTSAVAGFNREGSRTRTVLGAVGGAGGALGILGGALVVGGIAWGLYAKHQAEAKHRVEELKDALDQQTGAVTDNARELAFNNLTNNGAIESAKKLGISLQDLTDAALGNADAQARVNAALDASGKTMTGYSVTAGRGAHAQQLFNGDVVKVRDALSTQNEELVKARRALEDARAAGVITQQQYDYMTGALHDQNVELGKNVEKLTEQEQMLGHLDAHIAWEQAVDDATQAVKDNGHTMDLNTQKGRDNARAFKNLADAALGLMKQAKDTNAPIDEQNRLQGILRQKLIDARIAMGDSKREAKEYTDKLLGIPKTAKTNVSTPGSAAANAELEALKNHLLGLPKSVPIKVGIASGTVGVGGFRAAATGGPIGSGVGTVDEVPVLAMRGEHMWTTREVAGAGGHGAMFRLRAAARAGRLRGYAGGGIISNLPISQRATGGDAAMSAAEDRLVAIARKVLLSMGGGSLGGIGWARQWAAVHAAFPGAALLSSYRPGAITVSGNRSYHAIGRAIDVTPSMAIFDWIRSNYGARTKELIYTPAGSRQIKDGRPHVYSGPVAAQHYSHVHWAYDQGGLATGAGWLPKMTGAPERVLSPRQTSAFEDLVRVLDRPGAAGGINLQVVMPNYIGPLDTLKRSLSDLARTGQLAGVLRAAGVKF